MNILPLIIGLLFVFSCLAFTFLRDVKSLVIAEWSLTAAARAERAVNNRIEERKFRRAPSAPKHEPKTAEISSEPKQEKKNEISFHLRAIIPHPHTAKLNLTPLFEPIANPSQHIIYKTAARLLVILYQDTPIIEKNHKKGWEVHLLNALIRQRKSLSASRALADLFPEDPELQSLYYKMLKGTNHYSTESKVGIPVLNDFFTLEEEKNETAVYFHFAPPALLKALFGEKLAEEILSAETRQRTNTYRILDQNKIEELFLKHSTSSEGLSTFEPYLNFSKQIPIKQQMTGIDPQTRMRVTRPCGKKT